MERLCLAGLRDSNDCDGVISFARRRAFLRMYQKARFRFDQTQYWFWEDVLGYKPRPHDVVGLFSLFFYTDCPICFFLRGVAVGATNCPGLLGRVPSDLKEDDHLLDMAPSPIQRVNYADPTRPVWCVGHVVAADDDRGKRAKSHATAERSGMHAAYQHDVGRQGHELVCLRV